MRGTIKALLPVLAVALLALYSCREAPPTPPPAPPIPADVTINLAAERIAFDKSTITVPAGARVNVAFINNESVITHNFAIYESSAADKAIFQGKFISGGNSVNNEFTVPSTPGTYYFRCDVHPTIMHGEFIVTAPENK